MKVTRLLILWVSLNWATGLFAQELPETPDDIAISLVASEPLVRNPSAIAFDQKGRLCVGQGPQYRGPTPETEGDRVDMLVDEDGDGVADRAQTFAKGFNSIQGLAWKGGDLYIANAPDLTIARDLDGDDVADEYVRLYTGLGSLEHGLHGLNFAPDGKLYFSKGNTKGRNTMGQLAPKAFRELWGLPSPEGAPDFPEPVVFTADTYQKNYKEPQDDWGRQGGVLRCDPDGSGLEIVARGMRNPWDIAFDDHFHWLGTDNDQTQGDKFIAPFFGAHYGWGHEWSYNWEGKDHLPTVPANGPLFEGSGAGVVWFDEPALPERFRQSFLVADWLRRVIYVYRPVWQEAQLMPEGVRTLADFEILADAGGGRAMAKSSGVLFDPTDMAVGLDGAVYVASWGREYGLVLDQEGEQANAGRVFRIAGTKGALSSEESIWPEDLSKVSETLLVEALDSPLDARRVVAQDELVRRQNPMALLMCLEEGDALSERQRTWLSWALARSKTAEDRVHGFFAAQLSASEGIEDRITALRILAFLGVLPEDLDKLFRSPEPRLRLAAAVAVLETGDPRFVEALLEASARETSQVVYFAQWNALRTLLAPEDRRDLLEDERQGVRLAGLLGLMEEGNIDVEVVRTFTGDPDVRIARLAEDWLEKAGFGSQSLLTMSPKPGTSFVGDSVDVTLSTSVEGGEIHFTLDGNPPVENSPRYRGPVRVSEGQKLRAVVLRQRVQVGRAFEGSWERDRTPPYQPRSFLTEIEAKSGRAYTMDWVGLRAGAWVYSDREYRLRSIPDALLGLPYLRTANADDGSAGQAWIRMKSDEPVTVHVALDARLSEPPAWMNVGQPEGFHATAMEIGSDDPKTLKLYSKAYPAGEIVLGGNTNDGKGGGKGNYLVVFERGILPRTPTEPVTVEAVLAALPTADPARGRDLFLNSRGAGCYQCHRMEGRGNVFAPDLAGIGARADAHTLVESILQPSATITEGFAMQVFTMDSGALLSGIVLEETAQQVTLGMMGGVQQTLDVDNIVKRESSHLSAMPAGYGAMMDAKQIAHLTTWLLEQKPSFSFRQNEESLDLLFNGRPFATYLLNHPDLTRRAFVNVHSPSGIQVTRNFPPRKPEDLDPGYKGEDGIIHPVMHPGLWMSFGWIDGNDYWRLQSKVKFQEFLDEPFAEGVEAAFATRDRYLNREGDETICYQDTEYRFRKVEEGILVDWDATFYNDERAFVFGDQEESGLALRVASPLRVQWGNGEIVNNRGEKNGAGTWGKTFEWIAYSGESGGKQVGLMVMPHPENPRPCWSHSRDYGVLVSNPFPKQPKEGREPYIATTIPQGERFRLRYRVLIHETEVGAFDSSEFAEKVWNHK